MPRYSITTVRSQGPAEAEHFVSYIHENLVSKLILNSDEIDNPEVWLSMLNSNVSDGVPYWDIIFAYNESPRNVIGALVFEYFQKSQSILITYIAVSPEFQNMGIASALLRHLRKCFPLASKDLCKAIFGETEDPRKLCNKEAIENAERRLPVLSMLGFVGLDFNYIQPPLSKGKKPVNYLLLMIHRDFVPPSGKVQGAEVLSFLLSFYSSLGVMDPFSDSMYSNSLESLQPPNTLDIIDLSLLPTR